MKKFQTFLYALSCLVLTLSTFEPAGAVLIDHGLVEKDVTQYDGRVGEECADGDVNTPAGGDVDRFLQVLADQESDGNPRAQNPASSASGKYQYIDGTWAARGKPINEGGVYPPASQYAHAKDAPEAVQDAVAYIEYSKKFVDFNGDIFKLAVSHFYPIANENPDLLDVVPPSNTITPREYADSILRKITEGVGTNIPLKYRDAPQFTRYNTAGINENTNDPTEAPTQDDTPAGTRGKVFLDPGHGAAISEYTDRATGLRDRETSNGQESEDVLQVARRVKTKLEADGYTVSLSRNDNRTPVSKRERVDAAKDMNANIAVSIHTTPGSLNDVWPQRTGTYREYGSTRVTFGNRSTADRSQRYAEDIAAARRDSEGREVSLDANNTHQAEAFDRADVPSKGNISLVQLWSREVPWVYNEFARGNADGLSESDKQKYADGLINGIKEALGFTDEITPPGIECLDNDSPQPTGDFTQTVLSYAWPTYHSAPYLRMQPAYREAVRISTRDGIYNGGIRYDGIDCGGFVTLLMLNSGFEPDYNHKGRGGYTAIQQAWAEANWEKLGSGSTIDTGSLQPGDVAFSPGHTFVYVGTIEGFSEKIASASLDQRAPMAGSESLTSGTTWYRRR